MTSLSLGKSQAEIFYNRGGWVTHEYPLIKGLCEEENDNEGVNS